MRNFTQTLKFFFLACALMCTIGVLGGNVTMKVTAESSPATQGYVYVAKSNSAPSSYSLTSDYAEETQYSAYILFYGYTTVSQDFYLFASPKSGYSFKGWSKNSSATSGDTSNPKKVTLSGKESGTVTDGPYYAIFAPADYTVTFDANGGSVTPASKTVTFDATYGTLPAAPNVARAGYTFAGWWTSASGGTQVTSSTTVTTASNHTLYAHWTANNYTVTLESPAASTHGTPSFGVTYDAVTIASITPPSRDKYTFWGYFTGSDSTGTQLIDRYGNVLTSVSGYTSDTRKWKYANDLTLYAYLMAKSDQTINWTLTENVEYTTGQAMGATATSGLPITYTSNHPEWGYINDGLLVVVVPNKTITITASQAGDDYYNPAPNVTKTFITLGANPNQTTEVTASGIRYGQTLSASTLSGEVKLNDVKIDGTLSWVDPAVMPNAGTAGHMVLFTPDNTDAYSPIYFEVPVTVAKANPVITWNISSILREGVRYSNFVVSSNKEQDDITITVSNTTLLNVDGFVLTTGEVETKQTGLTITFTQAASANYNAVSEPFTVAIYPRAGICLSNLSNPMTENDYAQAKVAQNGNVSWCNTNEDGHDTYLLVSATYTQRVGIALGDWQGGGEYASKTVDIAFSGIPNVISFDYEVQSVSTPGISWPATSIDWYLRESADGETFTERVHRTDKSGSVSYTLDENTRYVRIEYGGNFAGFIKNLRITQKKYLNADKAELTFGTETHPLQEPQAITLSYSSLGVCSGMNDSIAVTSNNAAFYVDEPTITENVGIEQKGTYTIRVRCNDVNQSGKLTFTSNDGTVLEVPVHSTKPDITTAATDIFQTGTEHAPGSEPYRAQRTLITSNILSGLFNSSTPIFDTLYIFGVSESAASSREWEYSPAKGYKVPVVTASNVHTPCFVYKKDGSQYTYVRTFDAATKTLNVADSKTRVFVGYRPAGPATTAIQLGASAAINLNNTEIVATSAAVTVNGNATISARGANIVASTSNTAVKLSGSTTLTIADNWKSGEASAVLALRPYTRYPSIDLGSDNGRVDINGTQLELRNGTHMAIAHMSGTTELFDGEVHINDGSIGGEDILGMPKYTFIDGGTFNDGTVAAYTLKGKPKRPRNSRGEMLSRQTMTEEALVAGYSWYGHAHLTPDASAKVYPMLMDPEVWIFNGDAGEAYSTAGSWNKGDVPGEDDDVLINAPMVISGGELPVHSITVNWENKGKGIPAVTINFNGGLTVGEDGYDAMKVVDPINNLVLKADQDPSSETKGQTGFLRVHPESAEPMPQATVELFTKGYYNMAVENHQDVGTWQYVGSPMVGGTAAKTVFVSSMIYDWNETTGEWKNNRRNLKLSPFAGYATSQYNENGLVVTFKGQLAENTTVDLPLTYTSTSASPGSNVFANSFMAPIDITKLDEKEDFSDGVEATIHLFNTGSRNDIKDNAESEELDAAGQYISIPVKNASKLKAMAGYPTVIPAMQGFYVSTNKAGTFTLDYEKLVWNTNLKEQPNTALRVKANEQIKEGSLKISLTSKGLIDNLYLLKSEENESSFENGYDAHKRMSCAFNIFAVEGEDLLAVDATNSIVGTRVGVRTGEETEYTFRFSHLQTENDLVLWDKEARMKIYINESTEYTFFAAPNSTITERFEIVAANVPQITTGVDEIENETHIHKFIKDNQLYILKDGVLYNASGAVVRK